MAVKAAHAVLIATWLSAAALLYAAPCLGWLISLYCALFSLWYVPFGTVMGLAAIGMVVQRSVRESLLQAGSRPSFASSAMPVRPSIGAPPLRRGSLLRFPHTAAAHHDALLILFAGLAGAFLGLLAVGGRGGAHRYEVIGAPVAVDEDRARAR